MLKNGSKEDAQDAQGEIRSALDSVCFQPLLFDDCGQGLAVDRIARWGLRAASHGTACDGLSASSDARRSFAVACDANREPHYVGAENNRHRERRHSLTSASLKAMQRYVRRGALSGAHSSVSSCNSQFGTEAVLRP